MWNELESYKNHFLQKELKHMKPEMINHMVTKDFKNAQAKHEDCQSPKKIKCTHSSYFDDRAKLAYGFYALPKLMVEVNSDDPVTLWRGLYSLSEYILNPLHAQRAITEMEIVRKMQNSFLRFRYKYKTEYFKETWRLMHIFHTLSLYLNGAEQIVKRQILMKEFYKIIFNKERDILLAAQICRNLSEKPEVLLILLEQEKPLEYLFEIFHKDLCAPYYPNDLWVHLSHFIEVAPQQCMQKGFFDIFHQRIVGRLPQYYGLNMKCFGLLLRCSEAQQRYDNDDGVRTLYDILAMEQLDTYEFVVLAFLHGLMSKRALWRCREFTNIPDILLRLLKKNDSNTRLQLYCIQTMRQMGEMPCIKRYMKGNCLEALKSEECLNKFNECTRDDIVWWLNHEIYETDD